MAGVTVEPVAGPFILGEGPHWDDKAQKLYFVDIIGQKICCFDHATGSLTSAYIEHGTVGVAVPVEGASDKFVAGCGTDFILVTWNGEKNVEKCPFKKLAQVDTEKTGTRWNDGKVDSSGRFWGGTMAIEKDGKLTPDEGAFYSIGSDLVPKKHISPVSISNGLVWSKENDTFYYIDSLTYQVFGFDYDAAKATISNKRVVFDLKKNNVTGLPDGMTMDTDGNLWIALYFGSSVIQINPKTGELMRTISIPARNITSVAFGGPNLDILYVTSSRYGLKESELNEQPHAGYLFAVKGLGVRGFPANSFKMNA